MTYRTFVVRLLMATLCAVCVLAVATLFNRSTEGGNDALSPEQGMRLKAPSFINVAYASNQQASDSDFLQAEAGISAYTNVGTPIDLARIESLFTRGSKKQPDEYIVGSMIPPGYEELPKELQEDVEVNVYVHRDGWIVAYLLEWQDRSLIVDWLGYFALSLHVGEIQSSWSVRSAIVNN